MPKIEPIDGRFLHSSGRMMACLICHEEQTIRAHLIPKALATEVNAGKAHAARVTEKGDFIYSQTGLHDPRILCKKCDNRIGMFERYAAEVLRRVRRETAGIGWGPIAVANVDGDLLLRFAAGILWKYSVTRKEFGRVRLGPYQRVMRALAFEDASVPESVDACLFRLRRSIDDDGVFTYRAPKRDRKRSTNLMRFMVGGCVFFIRTDKRALRDQNLEQAWIRGKKDITVIVAPAQIFEEFRTPAALLSGNSSLSRFIGSQEAST